MVGSVGPTASDGSTPTAHLTMTVPGSASAVNSQLVTDEVQGIKSSTPITESSGTTLLSVISGSTNGLSSRTATGSSSPYAQSSANIGCNRSDFSLLSIIALFILF